MSNSSNRGRPQVAGDFSINAPHIFLWILAAGLTAGLEWSVRGGNAAMNDLYFWPRLIGSAAALLVIPSIAGWVAFGLAKHSQRAAGAVFLVVLVLLTTVRISQVSGQRQVQAATATLKKLERATVADLKDALATNNMAKVSKTVEKQVVELQKMAADLPAEPAVVAAVTAALTGRLKAAFDDYTTAMRRLIDSGGMDPANIASKDQLASRRQIVQACQQANQRYRRTIEGSEDFLRDELTRQKASPNLRDRYMRDFRMRTATMMPKLMRIRGMDEEMTQAMLQTLDLLEEQWGRWHCTGPDRVQFQDAQTVRQYNALASRIKRLAAEQSRMAAQVTDSLW